MIDDEEEILDLLEIVLRKEGFRHIYKASLGYKGIEMCKSINPDLIVLDIMLPDIDGFSVCQEIRSFTMAPIFFLSAREEDVDRIVGLSIGADDYITKPFSPKEVAYRMKAFFRRDRYLRGEHQPIHSNVYQFGDIIINEKSGEVFKNNKTLHLTAKEYQLLLFLAKNPNQVFSKSSLYEAIWNEEYYGSDNVIMVHIRHLREKIEDDPSNPKYLITVRGLGYKLNTKE
ncbi:response regulator transcription factor [Aeribacillus pallidus]|uniref:response regulator transcription factor n=1 Tax=Aeribacillus pallidus TaxID=33936 RepID=UPI003D1FA316